MTTSQKYLTMGIGIFLMILLGTLIPQISWTLSPFYYLGFVFIMIGVLSPFIVQAWQGQTNQAISNRGHVSIRIKDIFTVSQQELESKDSKRKTSQSSTTILLTGGFDVGLPWGISWPGSVSDPVYIFPSNYCHKTERNDFDITANLGPCEFKELPSYLCDECRALNRLPESRNRVHPTKTPILYATTSHMDGSATPENLKTERQQKDMNREIAEYKDTIERLYEAKRKHEDSTRKQYIIGKPIKPIEEE